MTMTVAMPSSSSSRRGGLRGPRPLPLKVSSSSSRGSSPSSSASKGASKKAAAAPVIVYEHTPKVVHARPQEFMTVVQRLTGKPPAAPPVMMPAYDAPAMVEQGAAAACGAGGDPLLLTLGQRQAAASAPAQPPAVPSPMMAAGMLLSPGFVFSPNTMQSIQELSPLF
uniref:VQ domain-containing protein n=1 Tax=Oryza rufipogon TaxID=4529 RepID=A0A0E0P2B0_ORYRU